MKTSEALSDGGTAVGLNAAERENRKNNLDPHEQAADHLFVMNPVPGQRYVHLRAARIRNAAFCRDAVPVPVMPDFFEDLKHEAVASRRILIPKVSSI